MMKRIIFLIFIFANKFFLIAQPTIQWQKSLGGSNEDHALSIQQTFDGGYIVVGWAMSNDGDIINLHGSYDYWVVKLNSIGDTVWQKTFGGAFYNYGISIQQTTDSGYIVSGYTTSNDQDVSGNNGSYDYWILKLSIAGTIQWQKCFGGSAGDFAQSIIQTSDGGYVVAGYSNSVDSDITFNNGNMDYWVVKLNNLGDTLWQKTFGGSQIDAAMSIKQTFDSGYIVAGHTKSNNGDVSGQHGTAGLTTDCWVLKLNALGTIQWSKALGGTGNDAATSVIQTYDSSFIVAGFSESVDGDVTGNHGGDDYWIVKLKSNGDTLWEKSFGGAAEDRAASIQQTSDSGYIVAGYSASINGNVTGNQGGRDYWIVKLNSGGTIDWQKTYGGSGEDYAQSIQQTTDDGYIIAGYTSSINGDVTGHHGIALNNDYWIVKLLKVISDVEEIKPAITNLQVVPNPVSQSTIISFSIFQSGNISVSVYDITGRLVKNLIEGDFKQGVNLISWNISEEWNVNDGIYFLNFSGAGFSQSFKLAVLKGY